MSELRGTEQRNPHSLHLDEWSTLEIVQFMNKEDEGVAQAVRGALAEISLAVDGIADRWKRGGRCFVVGAGTSGRLAVVDAVELVPTFSIAQNRWVPLLAGGYEAMWNSLEETEDDDNWIIAALNSHSLAKDDVVIGVTASGSTPFVLAAAKLAAQVGAMTIGISNNEQTVLSSICEIGIEAPTGPEVIRGSTRLKAGTAQKMILNMLSTATMTKLGKVYQNEMADMKLINKKLVDRAVQMLINITDTTEEEARAALMSADLNLKSAAFLILTGAAAEEAAEFLTQSEGHLKKAIQLYFQDVKEGRA
ncbi:MULTISPECIES: N-acetylmuramic acid 6-phosphate etherase [Bacillaceae]|uniref:N-acetylmuramic acid 6-phosphate etherase n=1 Tax=Bacillaceae TaxID=186817 RepID=UPI001E2D4C92|nr:MULTISPECIES: N-acetylmuramic acid 6-phosphate etherase [Bacillaceae]MCE4050537.1 N-acetylmuramic acid 6-phosphate etherase [Bacillus sp. Au-Bac7]MCM3030558.1 N-acetylmuramic acid 6-phosphate etherase [Niallia sp. MER 6]MDL0434518.1 N-acetylmuramic acid 6-phosphate etherase [Niallia sp. SS-2023]UPO88510.1 N-acetylmuramic acid 6-phosphate etherase [Niallia sp. Man26]